jgi:hypothetical protein
MGGEEITHQPDGSWIRDIVRFKCNGREFIFRQRRDVALAKTETLKGTFCETSIVEVEGVKTTQLDSVLNALDAICWLLSFVCQSRVMRYGYCFPTATTHGHFRSVSGTANNFRTALDLHDAVAVKSFVEQAYPAFCRFEKKRKLAAVFDYLAQAERPNQPTEIRLLLLFVTLESLKDTYARETGIPYIKGFFRKPPRKHGKLGAAFSFEELLQQMLRSAGMRRGLKQVITLRNEIIHSGLSRRPHSRQWQMYERIQDIVREYIFRLLNYHGNFFTYSSGGMTVRMV